MSNLAPSKPLPNLTLTQHIMRKQSLHPDARGQLSALITQIGVAGKLIAAQVRRAGLIEVWGATGETNVQGETVQILDRIAQDILVDVLRRSGCVAAMASEEEHEIIEVPSAQSGDYVVLFDPLDGSTNIDANVSIGTIFSVLRKVGHHRGVSEEDFLQPGRAQAAAGYCVYGPQTTLVLTVGTGVAMFTLDRETGSWVLTSNEVQIPADTKEFAINMSNMRHWAAPVRTYIDECLAGKDGPRGKDFNMRWVASMVADVHRILTRGGIFMYPWDQREPDKPGKLRLMYEANPMAFIVEQAGGMATNGRQRILDIAPSKLHERVSVVLGSKNEVQRVTDYHLAAD